MKKNFKLQIKNVISSILFIVYLLIVNVIYAQPYYTIRKYDALSNYTPSQLFQYDINGVNNLGLLYNVANYPLTAAFQIKDNLSATRPLFQVDGVNGLNIGSIKLWSINATTNFGIYESSPSILQVRNYFQDPVTCGNVTLSGTPSSASYFSSGSTLSKMLFGFGPTTPTSPNIHLTVDSVGILVNSKARMNEFQLTNNPGIGKILVSDNLGNGKWTDLSGLDTNWLVNKDSDLYANPVRHHVGIGFKNSNQKIFQMLQILNGNILLTHSSSTIEAPTSKNGSILFGDSVTTKNTLGEWGIEYETNDTAYTANGLNFWKPYSCGNGGGDHYLYLRNDGNVGIGTNKTFGYKLAVDGKIICTELKVRKFTDWPDYVLKDDYKLPPLDEVAEYINKYQHLRDMPSAKEVSDNGINVGDMDVTLVKKIEELTKYIIDQQNMLTEQQKQVIGQQKQLLEQQKQIDELKQKIENR